jgi:hypothetical protein
MKSTIFWDMTSGSPLKVDRRFGGTYRLHLKIRKTCFHPGFLLGLFFFFLPWRSRWYVPPKRPGVISQMMALLNQYSETSLYRSQIIRFSVSIVQFLWSPRESYFNYGSCIYCFPGSIVSFSDPRQKRWIEVSLYYCFTKCTSDAAIPHSQCLRSG